MKLYMVYWRNAGIATVGGYILVALSDEHRREDAVDIAMRKAVAIHDKARFTKLEELSPAEGVLWTDEWFR